MPNSSATTEKPYSIGGQAVIEGVMMRGKTMYSMAVRKPDDEIEVVNQWLKPASDKYTFLKLPIVRGVNSFIDSLVMGTKILMKSAEMAGFEDDDPNEAPSKPYLFMEKIFGKNVNDVLLYGSMAVSLVLAMTLFMLLPVWLSSFFNTFLGGKTWLLGVVEGVVRMLIFLGYILLVSRTKEMQRVFMYHGAEHKTINCYEAKQPLTVENVRHYTRLNKRCGTSFLIIVMLISMLVFMFVKTDVVWLRFALRIVLVPVIAGLSYEVIRYAGTHDSAIVNFVSYPGLMLQKITTKEPDDKQLEVAIAALNGVLEGGQ